VHLAGDFDPVLGDLPPRRLLAREADGAQLLGGRLSPDPGGTLITDHFCGASIANGGAGNVKYARPNPHTGPAAWLGYTDTAGSLCLVKTNVLGSKPDSAANGDVQLQELLTSDSDTMGSKR